MSYFTVIFYFYFYKNTSYSTISSIQQSDYEILQRQSEEVLIDIIRLILPDFVHKKSVLWKKTIGPKEEFTGLLQELLSFLNWNTKKENLK